MRKPLKIISIAIMSVMLVFTLMPASTFAADRDGEAVSYLSKSWDSNKNKVVITPKTCSSYTDMSTVSDGATLDSGWYVVRGNVRKNGRLKVSGTCNIILCDGANLYCEYGIEVDAYDSAKLNIYAQSDGDNKGRLQCGYNNNLYRVSYNKENAGIGGSSNQASGIINIHGGTIEAWGGKEAAGIGGGKYGSTQDINIYGGDIKAWASEGDLIDGQCGAGIGGGAGGTIYMPLHIYGGTIDALAANKGAGIGGGYEADTSLPACGPIYILGGNVKAVSPAKGAGIGGSYESDSSYIEIRNANVTAIANSEGAGIGSGGGKSSIGEYEFETECGTIIIENSTVDATCKSGGGAGIGAGQYGNGERDSLSEISISNSTVTAFSDDSSGHAFGKGKNGSETGVVTIGPELQVSYGNSSSSTDRAVKSERISRMTSKRFAKVEPCKHSENLTIQPVDERTHHADCLYCERGLLEEHDVEGYTCTKCGLDVYKVTYDPNNGDPETSYYQIPEEIISGVYYAWEHTVVAAPTNVPEGMMFSCWVDEIGNSHDPDIPIQVTEARKFTARWVPEFKVTYDPNNGIDSNVTVSVEGYTDSEGNPTGAGFMTRKKPEHAPDGKQFIGWKIDGQGRLYGENDFVLLDSWNEGRVTLKAQWEERPSLIIKGVDANGVVTNISSLVYPCDAEHQTIRSVVESHEQEIIDYFNSNAEEGCKVYEYRWLVPEELSAYSKYDDLPTTADNTQWYNETVTADNNTIYVPIIKKVEEIDIPLKAPVCGGKVVTRENTLTHEPNPYQQDVRPELTVKDDDPFMNRNNGQGTYDYWEVDPDKDYVSKGVVDGYNCFIIDFIGGNTYTAHFILEAKVGYYFDDDLVAKVNGKTDDTAVREETKVYVNADIEAVHDYGEAGYTWADDHSKVTATRECVREDCDGSESETADTTGIVTKEPTCTEKGETTYTSAGFENEAFEAQTKTVDDVPALGHAWDSWTVIKDATETATGTKTHECTRCHKKETGTIPAKGYKPGEDPNQKGTDGTKVGPGASAASADKAITSLAADKDPKGAKYLPLKMKSTKQTKTSVTIKWAKQSRAKKYVIYGNKCGKKNKPKKLAEVTGSSKAFSKIAGKKVKKGTAYKFIIVALDKNNNVVSTSKMIHVYTKGGKYTNHKAVKVKAKVKGKYKVVKSVSVKKGKSKQIKAKGVKLAAKKKYQKHVAMRFESSKKTVATVNSKGVIKGKKKGTCYVYAYSQNGAAKKIKVTVK